MTYIEKYPYLHINLISGNMSIYENIEQTELRRLLKILTNQFDKRTLKLNGENIKLFIKEFNIK